MLELNLHYFSVLVHAVEGGSLFETSCSSARKTLVPSVIVLIDRLILKRKTPTRFPVRSNQTL